MTSGTATLNSGTGVPRSTLRRGLGSTACTNLRALSVQLEESAPSSHQQTGMQVDTTGDEWGYFVDAAPSIYGNVHISW